MADDDGEVLRQEVEITWEDVEEFAFSKEPRLREFDHWLGPPWNWRNDLIMVLACSLGTAAGRLLYPGSEAVQGSLVAIGAVAVTAAILFRMSWGKRLLERPRNRRKSRFRSLAGAATIELTPGGVGIHGERRDEWWSWATVNSIEPTAAAIYVQTDGWHTIIAPRRCFATQETFEAFAATAKEFKNNPRPEEPPQRGETLSPPFRLSAADLAASYVATAPSLVPGWWALGFAALMAAPTWRMFPLGNPEPLAVFVFSLELALVVYVLVGHKLIARRNLRRAALTAFAKSAPLDSLSIVSYDANHIFEQSHDTALGFRWGGVVSYAVTAETATFHAGDVIVILPAHAFADMDAYLDFVEGAVEARRAALAAA